MKVAVVGSRTAKSIMYDMLKKNIPSGCSEIISGGASGIDAMAEDYAKETGLRLSTFLPDYERYGKTAPIVRNKQIVRNADYVLCFWDGISSGTKNVIDECLKIQKPVRIIMLI